MAFLLTPPSTTLSSLPRCENNLSSFLRSLPSLGMAIDNDDADRSVSSIETNPLTFHAWTRNPCGRNVERERCFFCLIRWKKKWMKIWRKRESIFFFPRRGESTNGRVNDRMKSVFSLCLANNSESREMDFESSLDISVIFLHTSDIILRCVIFEARIRRKESSI